MLTLSFYLGRPPRRRGPLGVIASVVGGALLAAACVRSLRGACISVPAWNRWDPGCTGRLQTAPVRAGEAAPLTGSEACSACCDDYEAKSQTAELVLWPPQCTGACWTRATACSLRRRVSPASSSPSCSWRCCRCSSAPRSPASGYALRSAPMHSGHARQAFMGCMAILRVSHATYRFGACSAPLACCTSPQKQFACVVCIA